MGFATNLQGRMSHDALLSQQEAELHLLESMRRCMAMRVKCDREYALALGGVANQAQKLEKEDSFTGSLIAQAWKIMMDQTEALGRLIKQNADYLATYTMEKLNNFCMEKREVKKVYQEEHDRITNELLNLQNAVLKTKNEYQKCLDGYKIAKAKYEDHYLKGRPGKKLDEVKEKYQKACRKLHTTHNEYVLLLCEAAEYEKDFRSVLLPGLLQYQQTVQEELVDKWQLLLHEIALYMNFTTEKFQDLQKVIDDSIDKVKPEEEYNAFVEKYRTRPTSPVQFAFDPLLIEDSGGKLRPNHIMVDDLTFDTLKCREMDLKSRLKDCQSQLQEKQVKLARQEAEASSGKGDVNGRLSSMRHSLDTLRKEVNELRCLEHKLQKQHAVILGPLSELGCEELPPGCELLLENLAAEDLEQGDRKRQSQRIVEMLRKPFSKRSNPSSPNVARSKDATQIDKDSKQEKNQEISREQGLKEKSGEPLHSTDSGHGTGSSTTAESSMMTPNPLRSLLDEEWFHGVLPREEVVRLLGREGDFLVRETTRNEERQIVLSVRWGGHKHFIVQTTPEGHFRFEGPIFPSIQELIMYQYESKLPVTNRSGAVLRNAIARERWELSNDDVELLEKIGKGNFGDVYKAKLKPSNMDVAVKTCKMNLPDEQKKKFLQEGRILKQYDHPNIVKFIGICVHKQPIMIVMELVPGGSLITYLRNKGGTLNIKLLTGMCRDAAAGMRYLESKNCIHRDLAARNCLVGHNGIVKISDFGMSREEQEYVVSDGLKQIPIKWTAPEALNYGKYTSLCDVWSYGILSWEVFSRGGTPYTGSSNTRAREMIDSGYRLPAPEGTPDEMYGLMKRCWEYDPEDRPHFNEIHDIVEALFSRL